MHAHTWERFMMALLHSQGSLACLSFIKGNTRVGCWLLIKCSRRQRHWALHVLVYDLHWLHLSWSLHNLITVTWDSGRSAGVIKGINWESRKSYSVQCTAYADVLSRVIRFLIQSFENLKRHLLKKSYHITFNTPLINPKSSCFMYAIKTSIACQY